VLDAVDDLADDARPHGAKKLVGEQTAWRIRIGNYRVIYDIFDDELTVTVGTAASKGHRFSSVTDGCSGLHEVPTPRRRLNTRR